MLTSGYYIPQAQFSIDFCSLHNFKTEDNCTIINENTEFLICTSVSLFTRSESAYKCIELEIQ